MGNATCHADAFAGSDLDAASASERAAEDVGQWCFAYLMWLQRPHLRRSRAARQGLAARICAVLRERERDDDFFAYLFGRRGLGGAGPNGLGGRGATLVMQVLRADARLAELKLLPAELHVASATAS